MLRYIYADELHRFPGLADGMFRDRADQFRTRLGWDVTVDDRGHERDAYDDLNPLYVIWQRADGSHGGSMRFLPTTGRTMVNEHFVHLSHGVEFRSPLIWECTRFCLARGSEPRVAGALMVACGELMKGFALTNLVGVFDARMVRIYQRIGASPEVMGSTGTGRGQISVGLWSYAAADRAKVFARAELDLIVSESWFAAAFGQPFHAEERKCA